MSFPSELDRQYVIPDLIRNVIPDLIRNVIPDLIRNVIPDLIRDLLEIPGQARNDGDR